MSTLKVNDRDTANPDSPQDQQTPVAASTRLLWDPSWQCQSQPLQRCMVRRWTWHVKSRDWQAGDEITMWGVSELASLWNLHYVEVGISSFCFELYTIKLLLAYLMITMMLSNMLYGFLMYPNKPKASSMKPISRTNILVKTMLLISSTSVSSSGWGREEIERKRE